ncbi:MAG: hypothetical protein AAFY64_07285 [Pseudomonadota bacterium]
MSIGSTLAFPRGENDGETAGDIFQQSDPRGFFRVMFGLDYGLPDTASIVFRQIIRDMRATLGRPVKVLDLGSGYGTLPALIRHALDMDQLAHRYRDLDWSEIDTDELVRLDKHYFAGWPQLTDARFIAFDVHEGGTAYAQQVGLIDHVISSSPENGELADEDRAALSDVDLVISLNCADFLSDDAFKLLVDAIKSPHLCAAIFALRVSALHPLAAVLEARGLGHEKLESMTFVQRRFASSSEWTQVLLALETQGLSARGKEADGLLHAELHVMRPQAAITERKLSDLVSLHHSQSMTYANWRRRPWGV